MVYSREEFDTGTLYIIFIIVITVELVMKIIEVVHVFLVTV